MLQELEIKVHDLYDRFQDSFLKDDQQKIYSERDDLVQEVEQISQDKNNQAKILLLLGKLHDINSSYSSKSQQLLEKSLKFDMKNKDTWNALAYVLHKKGDFQKAQSYYEGCLENVGKNKVSLRELSVVLRQLGKDKERQENVEKSVKIAKQSLSLDLSDSKSWYFVGNAYLSSFFVCQKGIEELTNAIKSYNQAEKLSKIKIPDLYYNKGTVYQFMQDYNQSIENFKLAQNIDPSLKTDENIKQMTSQFILIHQLIQKKCLLKDHQLSQVIQTIPQEIKQQGYNLGSLSSIVDGQNKEKLISAKIISVVSQKGQVPAQFVILDQEGTFASLSLYNTSDEIYKIMKENVEIKIYDPIKRTISIKTNSYLNITIFDLNKIEVKDTKILETFSPTVLVNETLK